MSPTQKLFQRPHMASSFTSFNSLHHHHHRHFHSIAAAICKYPSHFFTFSPPKQTLQLKHTLLKQNIIHIVANSSTTYNEPYTKSSSTDKKKPNQPSSVVERKTRKKSMWYKDESKRGGSSSDSDQVRQDKKKDMGGSRKAKVNVETPELKMRVGLDMCSKRGDVMGAIKYYDSAQNEEIKLGQYHYTVLLYLCSSAAVGVVRPAKSGSGARTLDTVESSGEEEESGEELSNGDDENVELNTRKRFDDDVDGKKNLAWFSNGFVKRNARLLDGLNHPIKAGEDDGESVTDGNVKQEGGNEIRVSEDVKKYALQRGFEIYEKMCLDGVPVNEAALTSVARMAMSMGDGDMAFDMVKKMKSLGINPKLRSYGPALSAFCSSGDIDKAFAVEKHMLEHGVYPEEPELEALLRVSVGAGKGDKVYYMLHKLRTSVRRVSPSTADLIVKWFESKEAARVGKTKWDERLIREGIENGGGGWHGKGWLGKGKWLVLRTTIGTDGLCKCCGEKLVTIDLDPVETENFAESVASIAIKRERNSSFQKFQKWLDYYGPFEAVVDGANVGLFSQKKFIPSKVNAVVNGIRQKLPSKRWPLIVLHNRRITGGRMDERVNRALIEKWQIADALYATPTGSNDDWYWLYAAIKFKCLLVTNDEMRDHTFQLLGNDFFPRWKERHQVRFSFSDGGPVFHMPPPCSVVIQESEEGHWHIPVVSEHGYEAERTWLCIMRAKSRVAKKDSATKREDAEPRHYNKRLDRSATRTVNKSEPSIIAHQKDTENRPQEILRNLKDILSSSTLSNYGSILQEIETAEKIGGCLIDFQI